MQRYAIQYSDGTLGILAADASLEQGRAECASANHLEQHPDHLAVLVRVEIANIEQLEMPDDEAARCPHCGKEKA